MSDETSDLALGRLLLQAYRRAQAASLAKLQQRGHSKIRPGHLPVITNLDPDGTRITELANRAGMTRQMAGRLVRELEELDYVESRGDPTDQRAVIVSLTDLGSRFLGDAPAAITDVDRDYADLLGADELARLRAALITLINSPTA
jgi:DNA-binding MarR family transcriptional regulator